jgi:hypothetical protein
MGAWEKKFGSNLGGPIFNFVLVRFGLSGLEHRNINENNLTSSHEIDSASDTVRYIS